MNSDGYLLHVYKAGQLTVVGFGGHDLLDEVNLAECREEIVALVEANDCEILAFDLTGVKLIPSGLLGLLASLRELGIEVQLYNPSDDVREVLAITKLDRIMSIHKVTL
jgi:anti-anti-sigma factor